MLVIVDSDLGVVLYVDIMWFVGVVIGFFVEFFVVIDCVEFVVGDLCWFVCFGVGFWVVELCFGGDWC